MSDEPVPVDLDAFRLQRRAAADAEVERLAALDDLGYAQARKPAAKLLRISVADLDRIVKRKREEARAQADATAGSDPFADVEPWDEPVDGAELVEELLKIINRYCVLPEASPTLMAFWCLHAWVHDAFDISPILILSSPEKGCGKTTAIGVVGALTPRSIHSVNMSPAVLFRVVEKYKPTMLIDEADTFLGLAEELRGIINGGHNRLSAWVWRVEGEALEPRRFSAWAPKAIALIGSAPETIQDRAIRVQLRRKAEHEETVEFVNAEFVALAPVRRRCRRWADDNIAKLRTVRPSMPSWLKNRASDNVRAILSIADVVGGGWPDRLRAALAIAASRQSSDEPKSKGALLLRDIMEVFAQVRFDRLGSTDLVTRLCQLDEAPWATWRGGREPITPRGVKSMLEDYGVRPRRDKHGAYYARADFVEPVSRYVDKPFGKISSEGPENSVTSVIPSPRHPSITENRNETKGGCRNDAGDGIFEGDGKNVTKRHHGEDEDDPDVSNPEAWS